MTRIAVLLAFVSLALAKPPSKSEVAQLGKLARVWVDYARWCKVQGAVDEARAALDRAERADAATKDLAKLRSGLESTTAKSDVAGLDLRRKKAHTAAAKLLDKLAKFGEEPRHRLYALQAIGLDAGKKRVKQMATQAQRAVVLIRHPDHPMVGYVSLPKGWTAKRKWPVMIAVDGAGSGFRGRARNFTKTRGKRGYIVLTPCSLSNTNALQKKKYPFYDQALLDKYNADRFTFDHDGTLKLLEWLQQHLGASDQFAITGFSGGGNLCYGLTVRHPNRVIVCAPACANFSGMGFADAAHAEGGPPIRIMTGAKDPHREWTHGKVNGVPGIEPQTDRAMKALADLGFVDVERQLLPGVSHSPLAKQVWEWVDRIAPK